MKAGRKIFHAVKTSGINVETVKRSNWNANYGSGYSEIKLAMVAREKTIK